MRSFKSPFEGLVRLYAASYQGIPRKVWLLCTVFFVNRAGSMVMPFLSLYVILEQGMTKTQAAWILAAFGLGSLVGSVTGGRLTRLLDPIAVQKIALILSGTGFLALTRLESFGSLAVGVFCVSLCADGFRPAAMAAVVEASPPEKRTRSLALVRLAVNLGQSVGPAVGGLLVTIGYRWLFLADGLTCWAAAALLFVLLPAPKRAKGRLSDETSRGKARSVGGVWKDGHFLAFLAAVFLVACIFFQLLGTYPLHLHQVCGFSESTIGLLLGFNALMVVLLEMPLVHLLEGRPLLRIFGRGAVLLGLGFGLLPLDCSLPFVLFTVVLWTWGEMVTLPFSNALVAQRAGEGRSGEYMGAYSATFSLALLVAPPAGLWFYGRFGPLALWYSVGLLGPLCWALCRWLEARFSLPKGKLIPAAPKRRVADG